MLTNVGAGCSYSQWYVPVCNLIRYLFLVFWIFPLYKFASHHSNPITIYLITVFPLFFFSLKFAADGDALF